MSDKEYLTKRRLDLIAGIASKVRQDAYVAFQKTGKQKYRRIDAPITSEVIVGHLTGAQPIACYTVIGEQCSVGVLDFDDHDFAFGADGSDIGAPSIGKRHLRYACKVHRAEQSEDAAADIAGAWIVWVIGHQRPTFRFMICSEPLKAGADRQAVKRGPVGRGA